MGLIDSLVSIQSSLEDALSIFFDRVKACSPGGIMSLSKKQTYVVTQIFGTDPDLVPRVGDRIRLSPIAEH